MLAAERREPGDILVTDIESLAAESVECSIHIDGVPQDDRIDDQAEGAELILLAFAVALAQLAALAVEDDASKLVAPFSPI